MKEEIQLLQQASHEIKSLRGKKELKTELQAIAAVKKMCEESLSPDIHEAWIEAVKSLYITRNLVHYHVAGTTIGEDIDTCADCGINIRNEIHISIGE